MMAEFDRHAAAYRRRVEDAIAFSGQGLDFFTRVKADYLVDAISRHVGDPRRCRVLDVGCGIGETDHFICGRVGSLTGTDLSAAELEIARERNPDVEYVLGEADRLPFDGRSFDVAFAICVLHHVPPAQWSRFIAELFRVVSSGGIVAVVEHNPRNPLTRKVVSQIEFDADAVLLPRERVRDLLAGARADVVEERYVLFFPWDNRFLRRLDSRLGWLPLGAQHLVVGRVC